MPPMLLKKEALEAGNPLATYAAMLELESRYRNFKPLAGVYDEVRCNFEEFLGLPMAGVKAMALINKSKPAADATIPAGYEPEAALDVVEREAKRRESSSGRKSITCRRRGRSSSRSSPAVAARIPLLRRGNVHRFCDERPISAPRLSFGLLHHGSGIRRRDAHRQGARF